MVERALTDEVTLVRKAGDLATYIFAGKLLSYSAAFVGAVLIVRLLGPKDFGLFSVALFVPTVLMVGGDIGVSLALVKYLAESREKRDAQEGDLVWTAISFGVLLGALLSVIGLSITQFLSVHVLAKPEVLGLAYLASLQAFTLTTYNIIYYCLIGLEKSKLLAVLMLLSNVTQFTLGPLLIFLGVGAQGAVMAYVMGPLVGSLVMLSLLVKRIPLSKPKVTLLKKFLSYGAPIATGGVLSVILSQFYNLTIARFVSAESVGNYAAAIKVGVIYEVVTLPVMLAVLPAFSRLDPLKDAEKIQKGFAHGAKILTLVVVPFGLQMILLSNQVTRLLFGETYSEAGFYLLMYALFWLYVGGNQRLFEMLLMGAGDTRSLAFFSAVGLVSGLTAGSILIPIYRVPGLLATLLIAYWPGYILMALYVRKKWGVSLPVWQILRIYIAAFVASAPTLVIATMPLNDLMQVILSGAVTLFVYIIALPKLRALDISDTMVLENSFAALPYLSTLAQKVGRVLRRLM